MTQLALLPRHGYLRPYRLEDAGEMFAAVRESVDSVGRWMPWCHPGYVADDSVAWIERCQAGWQSGEAYEFGIFDTSDVYVGGAGLNQIDTLNHRANLGYWVRRSREGHGFATAAARALAEFGLETLGLTRIEIVAAGDNLASRSVALKVGAQLECVARNRLVIQGVPVDAAVHSLIPASATHS